MDQIERDILLREVLENLTPDERLVCIWKKAGFTSQEIADRRGGTAAAVDTLLSRVKQKIRGLVAFNPGVRTEMNLPADLTARVLTRHSAVPTSRIAMTNRGDQFDSPRFIVNDEVDELFGRANPNPNLIGCPPREVLPGLARRERPIDDPAYEHLANCSPCYQEFRAAQHSRVEQREPAAPSHLKWIAAVAAIVLLVAAGAWLYMRSRDSGREQSQPPTVAEVQVQLDLRPYAVARSPQDQSSQPQLVLPQGRLVLSVLLPTGSEPGLYDVQIRNAASLVLASATGPAEIRDFVTTLRLPIDVESVPAGAYQLAVRRQDEDWRFFPVTVR